MNQDPLNTMLSAFDDESVRRERAEAEVDRLREITPEMIERAARALGGYTAENGYTDEDWQAAGDASDLREKALRVLVEARR